MALTPYLWGKLIRVRFVAQGLDQSKYPVNVSCEDGAHRESPLLLFRSCSHSLTFIRVIFTGVTFMTRLFQ